ncbi:TM7S3/TM198-like domain-containing protein [Gordonia iterans]
MANVVIGILALLAGALFCFWGVAAMRFVIAVWGAFVGFNLGAGIVAALTSGGYLSTVLGWVVGVVVALAFALIAYLYYVVAVTLAMASIGFALGTALMVAMGVDWNWLIILVGVVLGVVLAWITLAARLPTILLIVLSAFAGSTVMVGGLMFLGDVVRTSEFTRSDVTARISDHWYWWVIYVVLAVVGIVTQTQLVNKNENLREQW